MSEANGTELVFHVRDLKRSYPLPRGGRLDVRRGEFVVLRGKSGIGKSTLLHLLGMLDRPDGGTLVLEGRDVTRAGTGRRAALKARRIGFVFQFYHLLPEFTALENVLVPGTIARSVGAWLPFRREARRRAAELLGRVGIADRADHLPAQLSGGERQRVALARALFNRPAILLCDEPTGNLDVATSESVHALLGEVNRELGQTVIVVTHDPGLEPYASRVIHLEDGKIREEAPLEES